MVATSSDVVIGRRLRAVAALLRPHQWLKNIVLFAPLMFSPWALNPRSFAILVAGFLCFCAVASSVYIINDLCDRASDRLHPRKRLRPLAAGIVGTHEALGLSGVLIGAALPLSYALSPDFAAVLAVYLAMNIAYSWKLKTVSIVDILVIAVGFVLRLQAGGVLAGIRPSGYLMTCVGLLALFMAIGKRRDDLVKGVDMNHRQSLSGYTPQFLDISMAVVLGALLVSYLTYTMDPAVAQRMGTDKLYMTLPFVLAGILRYLQITLVEERSGSPTRIVASDPFLIVAVCGWAVVFASLLYL
jgi:decaprenyl-phosphate phosphoribosyltransferase